MATAFDDEDVAIGFANLLREAANEHGAYNFAWNLAERGCTPENIRIMAKRWVDWDLQPYGFDAELESFAEELEKLSGSRDAVFR